MPYRMTIQDTYDSNGNITELKRGSNTIRYRYDGLDRMIREDTRIWIRASSMIMTWEGTCWQSMCMLIPQRKIRMRSRRLSVTVMMKHGKTC